MSTTKFPELIWYNGEIKPWAEAQVHVVCHAIHYGSSVFEGVRCYNTPKGPAIFRLQEHTRRLFDSAKIYRFDLGYTPEQINQACKDIVLQNGFKDAYLRPFGFMGAHGLGLNPPKVPLDVSVIALEWGSYLGEESLVNGVDAAITSWNRLAPNTMPTGAKAGGNYLSSILITTEAKRHGYVEGIGLDHNGTVSEGAGENLFVIRDGVINTPPLTAGILPGITRSTIMTLANDLGYTVNEQALPREALYLADEVFMCGSAAEVVPVRSVDQIVVGDGKRGPITEVLQKAYFDLVKGVSEDKYGWLTYLND
ncbi:branched-chain amino acid transaminase [Algibacillus agarilyticus]|uniref:branched-chain amino acid transaminase n=1 Tax=Algibacillus agarilyticus TaxID=2234133 RepID=UPI000DD0CF78|nr:branched-chain amino acid transaminase [Algibacillus agarilyticus]